MCARRRVTDYPNTHIHVFVALRFIILIWVVFVPFCHTIRLLCTFGFLLRIRRVQRMRLLCFCWFLFRTNVPIVQCTYECFFDRPPIRSVLFCSAHLHRIVSFHIIPLDLKSFIGSVAFIRFECEMISLLDNLTENNVLLFVNRFRWCDVCSSHLVWHVLVCRVVCVYCSAESIFSLLLLSTSSFLLKLIEVDFIPLLCSLICVRFFGTFQSVSQSVAVKERTKDG